MAQVIDRPSQSYTAGTRTFNLPHSASRKFSGLTASLTRENWPLPGEQALVTVIFERQIGNGPWEEVGRATFPGGVITYPRTDEVVLSCGVAFAWTTPAGAVHENDGDIRFIVTNIATLTTAVHVEMV